MLIDTVYHKAPRREIDQSIAWLTQIKQDCEYKIQQLERMRASHGSTDKYRAELLKAARNFAESDFLNVDEHNQTEIIRQRLGCTHTRAEQIREIVVRLVRKQKRQKRDMRIARLFEVGVTIKDIANDVDVSRQTVHTVLKKHKESPFF
jgi:DNA-binding NarL/FixJ family response regulator